MRTLPTTRPSSSVGGGARRRGRRSLGDSQPEGAGCLGVSVYLALDEPLAELSATLEELRRYGQVRLSTVGRVRSAGFALLATGDRPHFDIVLPDLDQATLTRLEAAFDPPQPNPGRAP